MKREIEWKSYWRKGLEDTTKSHAFTLGGTDIMGFKALCGYNPSPGRLASYRSTDRCSNCEKKTNS